jgi:hypothetical protein
MELCVEVALLGAGQAGLLAAPRGARALEERPESPSCGGLATPPLSPLSSTSTATPASAWRPLSRASRGSDGSSGSSSGSSASDSARTNSDCSSVADLDDVAQCVLEGRLPSHVAYKSETESYHGQYTSTRGMLDAQYHGFYRPSRQLTQDQIISYVLRSSGSIQRQRNPWIVFTAGAMGSGKSHTMRTLSERFSQLEQFCLVDQDEIRSLLPEWAKLIRKPASSSSTNAASLLQKESGYLSEISLEECLLASRSIVFDSSLRDGAWWASEFHRILTAYPQYRIAIVYVQTDLGTALARSESRAKLCGRDVPAQHVVDSFHQSRASFEQLKGVAHMSIVVDSTDAYPTAVEGDIAAFCSSLC